ncbi:hypothetical protein SEUCBS140593_000883 [Sporothrix eucalyptigena]|uniref:Major facilitator superfamily (MFS) profile domain-containing protein n=1 Tax=Sporothrix eucalyptigena TaxID=1812306 RepID=A0ABP0ATJ9_9PEZI
MSISDPKDNTVDETSSPPTPTALSSKKLSTTRRRLIMFSLCLALFLSALDITIVATALPTMARHLDASAAAYAWIGSGYTLANTSSIAVWARLSDIFGRRPVILAANLVFLVGSILSGVASSVGVLVVGRIVQGLGGGGSSVLVTIVISDLFALAERAKYYGLTGIVYAVACSVGPVLGGVFTQTIGWRWCFWINLPFCAISLVVLFFVLHLNPTEPSTPLLDGLKTLDWTGSVLIVGGTIAFLYGLETGAGSGDWSSPTVIGLLVAGGVVFALFAAYEHWLAPYPLIPTRSLFGSVTNCAALLTTVLHSFVFISYDYFLPLYFQVCLGFTPILSGVSLFALVIPLSFATMGSGFYVRRTRNYRAAMWAGVALMTLGTGLFIDFGAPPVSWAKIIVFQIIVGIGAGPLFQAPMIALQSHVAEKDVPATASASGFLRSLANSMSIVVGTVLLQRSLHGSDITDVSIPPDEYASAVRLMWIFYTAVCSALFVCTLFIKKMPVQKEDAEDTQDSQTEDVKEEVKIKEEV